MSISVKDRKLLWTKSGNRCSFIHKGVVCDKELISKDGDNDVITGEECHIVDKNPKTSRFIKDFLNKDTYDNLILMCGEHHSLIDSNGEEYTREILIDMKTLHEKYIVERLEKKEIEPVVIKDSFFKMEADNVDEAIGMEINRPAQLSNVGCELKAKNVGRAIGFSTNQGIAATITSCSSCKKQVPLTFTGKKPSRITCPHCSAEINLNSC